VQLSGVQAVATVNLIRALGGGWGGDSVDSAGARSSGSSIAQR
jgi:multidrug efflux system outer membrane protein